jgi:hypothetical protein
MDSGYAVQDRRPALEYKDEERPDLLKYSGEQERKSNRMIPFGQDYYLSLDSHPLPDQGQEGVDVKV